MQNAAKFCHSTVLVVDDNEINRDLISEILIREGHQVFSAEDGASCKRLAEEESLDLILLDINMPDQDGFDVIKDLKRSAATKSIPVIFITAKTEVKHKLKGFKLGAVDYITKPFHPMEVAARVKLHLRLSHATSTMVENQMNKLQQLSDAHKSLLTIPGDLTEAKFGVYFKSLFEVGGDFYDVIKIADDIFGYFISDFSGHDIKSSYMTSSLKALLLQNCIPIFHPYESIMMIHDVLTNLLSEGAFITASYIRLNRIKDQVEIINAGHTPTLFCPLGEEPVFINIEGDVIGAFKNVVFGEKTVKVSPRDRFYLYSDGLIESQRDEIQWSEGMQRLKSAVIASQGAPITEAPKLIIETLFNDKSNREDDTTILGFEV